MLSLLCVTLALAGAPPPADPPPIAASGAPVDWLIALDTAGTMRDVAMSQRDAVARLVAELPDHDRVQILATHTRVTTVLPRTELDAASRADLVAKVRALDLTSANDCDLGEAIASLTTLVGAKDASSTEHVFVIGRFCHAPGVTSSYDSGGHGCRPIQGLSGLTDGFAKARVGHDVEVRMFPMAPAGEAPDAAGIDQARRALGADVARQPSFTDWLAGWRPTLAQERLRPVLAADIARATLAITVKSPGNAETPEATLEVAAPLKALKIQLVNLTAAGATLKPGGVPVVGPAATVVAALAAPGVPFSLFHNHDTVPYDVKLDADLAYQPADVLTALGLPTSGGHWSGSTHVDLPREYGLPSPLGGIILFVAIGSTLGAFVVWRIRTMPRELGGSFHWRRGNGPKVELELAHREEAGIVVQGDVLAIGDPTRAVLVFRVSGPRWRPTAEVEVRQSGVEMNRRPLAPGRHPVIPGAASFQFGDYRLTWE